MAATPHGPGKSLRTQLWGVIAVFIGLAVFGTVLAVVQLEMGQRRLAQLSAVEFSRMQKTAVLAALAEEMGDSSARFILGADQDALAKQSLLLQQQLDRLDAALLQLSLGQDQSGILDLQRCSQSFRSSANIVLQVRMADLQAAAAFEARVRPALEAGGKDAAEVRRILGWIRQAEDPDAVAAQGGIPPALAGEVADHVRQAGRRQANLLHFNTEMNLILADMVRHARRAATTARNQCNQAVERRIGESRRQEVWLLVTLAGTLAVQLLLVRFFVGGRILRRLELVKVRLLHGGGASAPAPIPVGGDDEIAAMARSVEAFLADRRALELARDEAKAANQTKGAFLAAMSHEIRTPMNAVLNMVGAVLESPLEPQQQEYLKVADASARHLLSVINDILDFSKIEAGKIDMEDIPFSLHALLDGASDLFRVKVAESRVELVCRVDANVPDGVRGDPTRLRQILTNLIGNAFKFTSQGEVVLHAMRRDMDGRPGLRIEVKDTGIGISAEQKARLFQPFVQADAATTRRYGGTGLGLTISLKLARLMGGTVSLESAAGEGTSFFVDLPLREDPAGARGTLGLPTPLQGRTLLLIEDNAASREAMRVMFEQHGLVCVAFSAVEPALDWLHSPDGRGDLCAAVVDWRMADGGMDGLAGIRALRQLRAGLPCFLVSAFADRRVQAEIQAAGGAAFIPKPVTWAAVQSALCQVMAPVPAGVPAVAVGDRFDGILALLAEDNPQNQLVAQVMLKKLGIAVEVAGNGKLALEKAQANPGKYQIILMDMQMPEMDGLEATRRIRALPECRMLPIVAMTANAMKSDLDACLAAGMDGFVTKPIDKAALVAELGKVLKKGPHEP